VLETFLNAKPLYYDTIDYGRMPRIYDSIKEQFKLPKIIHIIGTNGKGTTGRFLATALHSLGFSVGHYTSPHILNFNERIWKNGRNIDTKTLDDAHQKLLTLLSPVDTEALSYFEYTTLLAMLIYEDVEYVVLEAGLGGEYDATAVFPKLLTLVTPIAKDHEAFLGNDIKSIATTKLNAIDKEAILAKQNFKEVYEIADALERDRGIQIYSMDSLLDDADREKVEEISRENHLVEYLEDNLKLAISALKYLHIAYDVKDFQKSRLYGRLTKFRENIILDVGHNTLAASAIQKSLQGSQYTLIYNSYKDKNYEEILHILKPIISEVEIIEVDDARVEKREVMQETIKSLHLNYAPFHKTLKQKNYLVFGSFSVVEAFLKAYNE